MTEESPPYLCASFSGLNQSVQPAGYSALNQSIIPAMSAASIARVAGWTEASLRLLPQVPFVTEHRLHAGMYFRTVTIPPPVPGDLSRSTGVLVKRDTVLTICGRVIVYMGEDEPPLFVNGQRVLLGSAGRKQAFLGLSEFTMTMAFATNAKTVAEAEAEFTDEIDLLCPLSDAERHDIIVTGE